MPRKNNDPPKSPGGRFAKKGSEKKRRRGSGPSLPLEDGAKGKRGSKSKGEANQAAAAAKPAKKMKSTWVPTQRRGSSRRCGLPPRSGYNARSGYNGACGRIVSSRTFCEMSGGVGDSLGSNGHMFLRGVARSRSSTP